MRGAGPRWAAGLAVVLAVVLAGPLAGCDLEGGTATEATKVATAPSPSADDGSYDPTEADEADIRQLMWDRQYAVLRHDRAAFRATVDPGQPKLLRTEMTLYDNLEKLPLATISYDVATTYLTPAPVPGHDPLVHPEIVENVRLRGTNDHSISNDIDVTVVRRGDHWLVGAERAPGAKGSVQDPQERPWFGVPVAVHHEDTLTVIVDRADSDQLDALVAAVRSGLERDADYLGVPSDDQVLVDATSNGEPTKVSAGSNAEAEAVTIPLFSTDGAAEADGGIAGVAIKVNPKRVRSLIGDSRLLWHELTHSLLFAHSGSSPVWLTEGVAAWVEWQPAEMDQLVVPDELYDKLQRPPHELPTRGVFYGNAEVSYPVGQAAVQWLVQRAGTAKLLELMRAYDRFRAGADADAETPKALRQVYGISEKQLVDGTWATLSTLHH